jgi:hypothetical protein
VRTPFITGEQRVTTGQVGRAGFTTWTLRIKVWWILAALVILPILTMWFMVVHQNDEILALVRNDVVTDAAGQRTWAGTFINTDDRTMRDVAVTVDLLDNENRTVAKAKAEAAELPADGRLELQASLPPDAVRLRIYSVQWRMGGTNALMGPFRVPWEFGYLMANAANVER